NDNVSARTTTMSSSNMRRSWPASMRKSTPTSFGEPQLRQGTHRSADRRRFHLLCCGFRHAHVVLQPSIVDRIDVARFQKLLHLPQRSGIVGPSLQRRLIQQQMRQLRNRGCSAERANGAGGMAEEGEVSAKRTGDGRDVF